MVWIISWFTKDDELKICEDRNKVLEAENKKFKIDNKVERFEVKFNYKVDLERKILKSFTPNKTPEVMYQEVLENFPALGESEELDAWLPLDAQKQNDGAVHVQVINGWSIVLAHEKGILLDGCFFHNYQEELFKVA
jgi:hypothetical protein